MEVILLRKFERQFEKLPKKIQKKFKERLGLFIEDRHHPQLRIHKLHGKDEGLTSMNITGDYRAVFEWEKETLTFHKIGTHHTLYGR